MSPKKFELCPVEAIRKEREDALAAQKALNEQVITDWQNRKMSELKERPEAFYKDSDTESQA